MMDIGADYMELNRKNWFKTAIPNINYETCSRCGTCAAICGGEPLIFSEGKVIIDENAVLGCMGCGNCMMVCPTGSVTVEGRRLSPENIIEMPGLESRATVHQLESLLLSRRSIREFQDRDVERESLDKIIEIASTAPMGIPPWEVGICVFHGRDKVQALARDTLPGIRRMVKWFNPIFLAIMRPFMGMANYLMYKKFLVPISRDICEEFKKGNDLLLYHAPAALLFHHSPCSEPEDSIIAATYAMVAAESMGLGTCMIGMVAPFIKYDKKLLRKYCIPDGNKPDLVLILGYSAKDFRCAIRRQFASVHYV